MRCPHCQMNLTRLTAEITERFTGQRYIWMSFNSELQIWRCPVFGEERFTGELFCSICGGFLDFAWRLVWKEERRLNYLEVYPTREALMETLL